MRAKLPKDTPATACVTVKVASGALVTLQQDPRVRMIEPDGRLGHLHCEPPLTLRRIRADGTTCALCLVGTAAGPLDDLDS